MAKNDKEQESLSKSKAKRISRQKEVAKEKRAKVIHSIVVGVIIAAILGFIGGVAGVSIYKNATRTVSISDFSKGLSESGLIEGVNTSNSVSLVDYSNISVPLSEVAATSEEVENDINATLSAHKEYNDDTSLEVADGDVVNIDYVGSIDGVEFDGGNSNGNGYDLTIGSGSFIDNFEQQLIGTHPGDDVTVNVKFPDDYSNADLAGKPAVFEVTVHSIQYTPEFNDEFVKTYLSDKASTAAEYKSQVEDNYYNQHLREYLDKYVLDNSEVKSYSKSYLKNIKGLLKYDDESTLSYYNSMFASYGMTMYENVWDVQNLENESAYEKDLTSRAKDTYKSLLVYQAIYEKAGLNIDLDSYLNEVAGENGEEYINNMKEYYGTGYLAQTRIKEVVLDYLVSISTID